NLELPGSTTSAFTSAEFQTLANYEATFGVRRASLYTRPDAGYGYSTFATQDVSSSTLNGSWNSTGCQVFMYVNCGGGVSITGGTAYPGTIASGTGTTALLTDSSGRTLIATRVYGDGREAMSLNFPQSPSLVHSLQLMHGVVSWATRGVFL